MKLFLSYTSADRAWAQWIGVTLRDAGHEMFVHEWQVGPGENIPRWMEEKVEAADKMIGVFSPSYVRAVHSNAERWAAYWHDPDGRDGFLVPIEVMKLDKWPAFAANKKRLSLVGLDEAEAANALVEFLKPPQAPTTRPPFPGGGGATGSAMTRPMGSGSAEAARGGSEPLFAGGSVSLPTSPPVFPPDQDDGSPSVPKVRLKDRDDLERWLRTQPRDVAVVLAVRVALRVAPLLGGRGRSKRGARTESTMLMPCLRGMAAPWAAAKYPAHGAALRFAAAAADAAAAAFAAAAALAADAAALAADAAAAAAFADATAAAAFIPSPDATAAAAAWLIFATVSADASAIEAGVLVEHLAAQPLWTGSVTDRREALNRRWEALKTSLQSRDEGWEIWTSWWEGRGDGRPADEEKEIARLTLPEEMWKAAMKSSEGVKAVNAEIARRFAEIDARRGSTERPERPHPKPGPTFHVADRGLEREPGPRPAAADGIILRDHARFRRHVEELALEIRRVDNRFPRLTRVVLNYEAAVSCAYEDIDLADLADSGLSLVEMADAFRRDNPLRTDTLDDETMAQLQSVAARHIAFVHRIPEMKDLADAPEADRKGNTVLAGIAAPMNTILERLGDLDRGLETRTKWFFQAVSYGLDETGGDHPDAVRAAYAALSNALIAISVHIDDVEQARLDGGTGVCESTLNTPPEDTRALIRFFRDNRTEIRLFAEPFAKLGLWLGWVYDRLETLRQP